jgi:hypothetical protein
MGSGSPSSGAFAETCRLVLALDRLGASVQEIEDRLDDLVGPPPAPLIADLERRSEDVRVALAEICDRYDTEDGETVGGLVFCALVELRARRERFSRISALHSGRELQAEAGGLLRNLKRALIAVQEALCADVGLQPTLSLAREQALALEVRAAYGRFRREIEEIAATCHPEEGDAGIALRRAAASIDELIGRDASRRLRFQDRQQLQALQERILDSQAEAAPDSAAARRLWQDLYSCTHLLQEVNSRQELVEHDRRVLEEIEELVASAPSAEAVRKRLIERASRLMGRDSTLDTLLRGSPAADELLAALRGLGLYGTGLK